MPIDPAVVEALRLLLELIEAGRFVVIGATVPVVLIDLRHGLSDGRATRDVDALVHMTSWEEFEELSRRLTAVGFHRRGAAHRFVHGLAEVDLIPYSRILAPGGRLEWPGEDQAMSTLGLEEAFESARPEQIGDLLVPMASVAACVLLKFVAYGDRPSERARDLVDIVHCFEHYGSEPGSRRYEVGEVEVDGGPVLYEEAGSYLLGQEVADLARPESLAAVHRVLASIQDGYAGSIQQILGEERRRFDADICRQELYRLFRVFAAGLD